MTNVYKVVRPYDDRLFSALCFTEPWVVEYPVGETVLAPKNSLIFAFSGNPAAVSFLRSQLGSAGEVWLAEATGTVELESCAAHIWLIDKFWDGWRNNTVNPEVCRTAPEGTIGCESITLIEPA